MAKRKNILIFVDWYLPGYKAGGPIKSVASLVAYLKNDARISGGGYNFQIITSNSDFGDSKPYPSVVSDSWIKLDSNTSVFYTSKFFLNRKNLLKLIQSIEFDAIYLNSFFSFYFSLLPLYFFKRRLINGPVLIAPRGMLGSGALQLKAKKKKLFIAFSKLIALHKHVYWHATSLQEENEIRAVFGEMGKIFVVPNMQLNDSSKILKSIQKNIGTVKLFFLSRISEKKNLLFALQIISNQKNLHGITFDIFGPIEDDLYWKKCLIQIDECKQRGAQIEYKGSVPSENVPNVMSSYHFLFLPTLNENYGHVIVESFLNGKPVILSDQTPWRNLKKCSAGWDIALNNSSKFDSVLDSCLQMTDEQYQFMVGETLVFAKNNCSPEAAIEGTVKMFNTLMNE